MFSSAFSFIALSLGAVVLAQIAGAPAGAVPDVVRTRCATCHGVDLIQQQRLSRAGWERELDKMIRWGAVVPVGDRALLLDYFDTLQPRPRMPPSGSGSESVGALYAQRCLGCHGSDIVEQQRLGSAGWRREVDKMVGWGARADPNEKDLLVSYLTERFGVR